MNKKGFTLIEILIVVAIIALLMGIVLASTVTMKEGGTYTKRLADIKELELALSRYNNTNNFYPNTGGAWWSITAGCSVTGGSEGGTTVAQTSWIPGIVPTYISSLPQDVKNPTNSCTLPLFIYKTNTRGTSFKLLLINNTTDLKTFTAKNSDMIDPARSNSYGFWTPDASAW
jgi:prepilin-type N-terminal cleavage/methylation domain-containing protein